MIIKCNKQLLQRLHLELKDVCYTVRIKKIQNIYILNKKMFYSECENQ